MTIAETAHEKASIFQNMLMKGLDEFFPEKNWKITSDDQPWISHKLKTMDRKRKRIFRRERKSAKWKNLDKMFKSEVKKAKAGFYKNSVADLKKKNPGSGTLG